MKILPLEKALDSIEKYLNNNVNTPFLIVVDDSNEYFEILNKLSTFTKIRVSDYCTNIDSFPDLDLLCDKLLTIDHRTLLLGLGESISLSGNASAIGRIKDLSISSKVIVLCRGVRNIIKDLCLSDKKFNNRRICYLKTGISFDIIKIPLQLNFSATNGFKELLLHLENGASDTLFVKTTLSLFNTRVVNSAYEAILYTEPTFNISQTCLHDNNWEEFLTNKNLEGFDIFHWRSYIKLKLEPSKNKYLKYVSDTSDNYISYKKNIFGALLNFHHEDKLFQELYTFRKSLLKDIKDSDIAEYVAETKIKDHERIYYLTDNTATERQAIIESLEGSTTLPTIIKSVYPALLEYLNDYLFTCDIGELLTKYFSEYKRLKLTNRISSEFHKKVLDFAVGGNRPYNILKARGEVLDSLEKSNTTLFWIDALGAEYLGYIQSHAQALGLKIFVHTVRANLPTITSFNKDFYDYWNGDKLQTKELDIIKHEGEHDFNYQTIKTPVHLAEELQIISNVLKKIKVKLAGKNVDKVILASDHGASRLAVLNEHECKWEMVSKGKHCGRCCLCSDFDDKPEYATEENNFWVLANYDRFKGGRKASVEVHGGATLEEVVIPLIEISLFDNKIEVNNVTPITKASFKKNAEIILFSKNKLKSVSVRVAGKNYSAEAIDNNKHKVVFPDIKKTGKYKADVFEKDNLIDQIEFEIQRESAKTNDEDWF